MQSNSSKDPKLTKVLVVEDEPQILRLIELELKYEGYDVITSADGKEALALVREHNPDLILLDCMLPSLSGEEVCLKLREEGFIFKFICYAYLMVIYLLTSDLPLIMEVDLSESC